MVRTVRRFGPDDWEAARAVRLAAVRDAFGQDSQFFREQAALEEPAWRTVLAGHTRFGAFVDDAPAGTVCWRPDGDDGLLYGMWVHPDARGTGLAGELVDAVLAVARGHGVRTLRLKVEPGNARALAFYTKTGFRVLEAPSDDAHRPTGLIVMTRALG